MWVSSAAMQGETTSEQDWRLTAELALDGESAGALQAVIARVRGPDVVRQIEPLLGHDVVLTHDGKLVFAYAAERATLIAARGAIEGVLQRDGLEAAVRIGHWDEQLDEWRQTDPPPGAEQTLRADAAERAAETIETRTMVASSGRMIREEFEQTMNNWAAKLGLDCKLIEHPHLLSTQVGFTVTGPKFKLDEFARGLQAEEWATIRTETTVMLSPL
jgi:hypothetical protein